MHRLVSPFILEQYAAGESSGQFDAAALFVDVSGFSTLTSTLMQHGQHGAEIMAQVMRAIFDPLVEAVYAQGGFITVFAGDAFTAVFPFAGATPALAAAWAIRDHMAAHAHHETPYGAFEIGVKVGLAMGEVHWGIIRSTDDARAAFYFRGNAIDACAHAEHLAQSGDLILHASALRDLRSAVEGEEVGDGIRVTGIATALPDPQPVSLALPDADILARFYPRSIIEQAQTGEFRQAINVFIGLEGAPGAETLATLVRAMFELQNKYGGLLNRIDFGDKGCSLLLFWGAPVSHENDVLRALNFVLDLHDVAPMRIRAGVTSRISHAGFIGSALHEEYTCYGNGVNLAARLMTSAPWEGIWVDEPVQMRVGHQFEMESEGRSTFKGFDEPQSIYALLGLRPADALDFFERQMVGRKEEMARLQAFVQPILRPAGPKRYAGMMVVSGEAGIGKSRLIYDFQKLLAQAPANQPIPQWFVGQSDQIVRQSLSPFRYWLRNYFGYVSAQSDAYNKRLFSRRLAQLINVCDEPALRRELERVQSILGALLGLRWEGSLYEQLDPQSRYESTFGALKTLLLAESLRQPVILLIEDAHWLDDDSKQFVYRLSQDIDAYPLAILAAARPEQDVAIFGPDVAYDEIVISGLAPDDLSQLAVNVLGSAPGTRLLTLLNERSNGNPFFAEQILFYLRDEGLLEPRAQGWGISEEALRASPLPGNVRAIFIARLDRLSHEVREAVQSAAILGREFEVRVLILMLDRVNALSLRWTSDILNHVHDAERAAIWSELSEMHYIFKHVLLRDAAYDMQIRTRRAEMHRIAAEALESLYADDLSDHFAELAYQYEAAYQSGLSEVAEQARLYLTRAGTQTLDRYENANAAAYFTRALALTPDSNLTERFDLLKQRELACHNIGDREPQRADLEAMQALAEQAQNTQWQMHSALRWANFYETISDYAGEAEQAQRLIALAQTAGDVEMEVEGVYEWGTSLYRTGQMAEAATRLEAAHDMARAANLPRLQADALLIGSYVSEVQGKFDLARDQLTEALALYHAIGNRFGEMNVYNTLGILDYNVGQYGEAYANFKRSADMAREMGRRLALSRFVGNMGYAATGLGDFVAARELTDESIRIFRDIGQINGVAIAQVNLGIIDIREGDYARAVMDLERAITIGREVEDFVAVAEALAYLAHAQALAGNHAAALATARDALELAHQVEDKGHEALALITLGHAKTALGEYEAARTDYRASRAICEELGQESKALENDAGLARIALAVGDTPTALAAIAPIEERLSATHLEDESHLAAHGLDGAEDPLWVWLTWFRILQAEGDDRAQPIIAHAHAILLAQADRFPDGEARQRFLQDVPYHREITAAYRQVMGIAEASAPVEETPAPAAKADYTIEPGADLTGADLHAADLAGANLRAAILVSANLRAADLSNANLRGADLSQANLRGADLTNADLRGSVLVGADVRGADFAGANLRGADLTNVTHDASTNWPEGFDMEES